MEQVESRGAKSQVRHQRGISDQSARVQASKWRLSLFDRQNVASVFGSRRIQTLSRLRVSPGTSHVVFVHQTSIGAAFSTTQRPLTGVVMVAQRVTHSV